MAEVDHGSVCLSGGYMELGVSNIFIDRRKHFVIGVCISLLAASIPWVPISNYATVVSLLVTVSILVWLTVIFRENGKRGRGQ